MKKVYTLIIFSLLVVSGVVFAAPENSSPRITNPRAVEMLASTVAPCTSGMTANPSKINIDTQYACTSKIIKCQKGWDIISPHVFNNRFVYSCLPHSKEPR